MLKHTEQVGCLLLTPLETNVLQALPLAIPLSVIAFERRLEVPTEKRNSSWAQ